MLLMIALLWLSPLQDRWWEASRVVTPEAAQGTRSGASSLESQDPAQIVIPTDPNQITPAWLFAILLILGAVFKFIGPLLDKVIPSKNGNGNGQKAGDLSADFWINSHREAAIDAQKPTLEILREISRTQQQQAQILTEVVTIMRERIKGR